jgi:hypothetical protein
VNEVQLPLLQIPDSAVNQPRGAARGSAREVVALDQRDVQAAHCGIARNAAARDASPDYEEVEFFSRKFNHSRKVERAAESGKVYGI